MAKDLEKAVEAWRVYGGCDGKVNVRDAQKLYSRAVRLANAVAKRRGMAATDAQRQIADEAKRRGFVCPRPGKDI